MAVPPPFTEAIVWLLGLDLTGKGEHSQVLFIRDTDSPLVVLTPTTQ